MSIALKLLAVVILVLGVAYSVLINPSAITSAKAADYGGAIAAVAMRFIPFALAAKWFWNKATGRTTSWSLIIILFLWIVVSLLSIGEARRERLSIAPDGHPAPAASESARKIAAVDQKILARQVAGLRRA